MKKTKQVVMMLGLMSLSASAYADVTGRYGIHLFFNEKEFVDVIEIQQDEAGKLQGEMFVPDDFDAPLENLEIKDGKIQFDVLVPKNRSRPRDLVFEYSGQYFDSSADQMIGFVRIKGTDEFVASFTGFRRD